MNLKKYRIAFVVATFIVALLVASPALQRLLVLPSPERFTELWLLGTNHEAQGYPFNITQGQNYTIYLGIGDRLGSGAYYVVEVKFRNQSQPGVNSSENTGSNMPPLYNISAFVADQQVWEKLLTFSIDYTYNANSSRVDFSSLRMNDVLLDLSGNSAEWNSTTNGFFGNLFFELWIYDPDNSAILTFRYNERFVGLWLNMTVT